MKQLKLKDLTVVHKQDKDAVIKELLIENASLKNKISKIQEVLNRATEGFKLFSLAFKSDI